MLNAKKRNCEYTLCSRFKQYTLFSENFTYFCLSDIFMEKCYLLRNISNCLFRISNLKLRYKTEYFKSIHLAFNSV